MNLSSSSSIKDCFEKLRATGSKALIPFITAGDPSLETTWQALKALDEHGADIIELGVPYSDPLADGPVIQAAATRALQRGTRLEAVLEGLGSLSLRAPIVLFIYYNPIYRAGLDTFMRRVREAGCRGLVVPDLPVEEADPLIAAAQAHELDVVLLVAPTSTPERMKWIAQRSSGFVYLVSTTGVTGQRQTLASRIPDLLGQLRQQTSLPIGVGFGISSPEQAKQVVDWGADAAIVGSAFVQRLAQGPNPEEGIQAISEFCRDLKAALKS